MKGAVVAYWLKRVVNLFFVKQKKLWHSPCLHYHNPGTHKTVKIFFLATIFINL